MRITAEKPSTVLLIEPDQISENYSRPPASRGLDIAAAALRKSSNEHSAIDPGPDSIPDIVRPNPADGVAVAAVQEAVGDLGVAISGSNV